MVSIYLRGPSTLRGPQDLQSRRWWAYSLGVGEVWWMMITMITMLTCIAHIDVGEYKSHLQTLKQRPLHYIGSFWYSENKHEIPKIMPDNIKNNAWQYQNVCLNTMSEHCQASHLGSFLRSQKWSLTISCTGLDSQKEHVCMGSLFSGGGHRYRLFPVSCFHKHYIFTMIYVNLRNEDKF